VGENSRGDHQDFSTLIALRNDAMHLKHMGVRDFRGNDEIDSRSVP
jgi:hypothetical protein